MNSIKYPLATEKSIRLMEAENTLIFVVDQKANKTDIKKDIEQAFSAKVKSVRTHITQGKKRAYISFTADTPAIDIATDLGVL